MKTHKIYEFTVCQRRSKGYASSSLAACAKSSSFNVRQLCCDSLFRSYAFSGGERSREKIILTLGSAQSTTPLTAFAFSKIFKKKITEEKYYAPSFIPRRKKKEKFYLLFKEKRVKKNCNR